MSISGNPEKDQILVWSNVSDIAGGSPTAQYRSYSLTNLLGIHDRQLQGVRNFGLPPLHFITQRGPQQDGSTPLDIRLDARTIQIVVERGFCDRFQFWDARNDLLDLIRPTRSFNGTIHPLIYRKWLPAGKTEYGSDGVSDGANTFTSDFGRFITRGGLAANDTINIGGTAYTITAVPNDYTLTLSTAPGAASDLQWNYRRRHAKRDLYCLLERGPTFDEYSAPQPTYPTGYREALRFVAHDPVWYGLEQEQDWEFPSNIGDLVFDGEGAWFSAPDVVVIPGRWLFDVTSISDTVEIIYWGTDPAIPTIEVLGPCDNFSITNMTTGDGFVYTTSIAVGTTVTFDLLALTVTDNLGTNLLPFVDGDISLFKLWPEPQAPNRSNVIAISFTGAEDATTATIKWRNRFIGI